MQPQHHSPGVWNRMEYRALEGTPPAGVSRGSALTRTGVTLRLRFRRVAVQLHRHRRQPRLRARHGGQHGRLEAGWHGHAGAARAACMACCAATFVITASGAQQANYITYKILVEAGLPPGA
jgi:hypothetical protein